MGRRVPSGQKQTPTAHSNLDLGALGEISHTRDESFSSFVLSLNLAPW